MSLYLHVFTAVGRKVKIDRVLLFLFLSYKKKHFNTFDATILNMELLRVITN